MNNGGYSSTDPLTLGGKVEEVIRADLGRTDAVPFTVDDAEDKGVSAGGFLKDAATSIFGGKATLVTTVNFDLKDPRPVELQVSVRRHGLGARLGSALLSTRLSKPVSGEVSLEDPKFLFGSKFIGDPAASERLNANKDLVKRAGKFSRVDCKNLELEAPRLFQIKADGGGAVLVVATCPRSYAVGLKVSYDVKEFIELAALIEAAL
jgi:hypothetical protein